jgi:hypothetical protein
MSGEVWLARESKSRKYVPKSAAADRQTVDCPAISLPAIVATGMGLGNLL